MARPPGSQSAEEERLVCLYCGEPITPGEAVVPIGPATRRGVRRRWQHRACALRQVIGSVAHQEERCTCYGGTATDDDGLTRRQAAEAAYAYWQQRRSGRR